MKILHTSDWHLGQSFFNKSRKAEHQAFLDWLLDVIREQQVNAVIVAGDVFDTGAPPSYAREMYNRFVVEISQVDCTLVVLGGNHDSVAMLNESKQLLACLNTHVIADVSNEEGAEADQLIELKDQTGETGAIVCAIPFIRPRDVVASRAGESGVQKQQALGEAIKQHYHRIYQAAVALRESKHLQVPIIATGHLTALGVSQSESVRDIYIGSLDGFAAVGFPPADYIALGHIHRPQKVAKSEHIRYSGSPIPLSFDELNTAKQVVLVEFESLPLFASAPVITPIDVPTFQQLAVIKGDLATIEQQLKSFEKEDTGQPVWLCVEVESQEFLADLPQRVQALTEGLAVEVLQLRRARNTSRQTLNQREQETLAELAPLDVFAKRLELESLEGEEDRARLERIQTRFRNVVAEVEDPNISSAEGERAL